MAIPYVLPTLKQTYSDQFYATLLAILQSSGTSGDIAVPRLTLIASVKVKIDEMMAQSEGTQYNPDNSDNSNIIDLYINSLLDEAAKHIHQTAPIHIINPSENDATLVTASDKTGYIDLPDNYLRMVAFKLSGWTQEVTKPILASDPRYKRQKYAAIRGGAAKPVCVINSRVKVQAAVKQVETLTLIGATGTANITCEGVEQLATFAAAGTTDLEQTATDFVTAWATSYLAAGVVLTSSGDDLIFTANVAGTAFVAPVILNVTTDLNGTIVHTTANTPARQGVRTLEYYSASAEADTLDKFTYIANLGADYIQSNLYDALTWYCASQVLQIWGQFSGQASYAEKALERVQLCYQNLL